MEVSESCTKEVRTRCGETSGFAYNVNSARRHDHEHGTAGEQRVARAGQPLAVGVERQAGKRLLDAEGGRAHIKAASSRVRA